MPRKKKATEETDLGGSAAGSEETLQSLVSFNTNDSRVTPVSFEDKEVKVSGKSAKDFYQESTRGGRGLTDEEARQIRIDAGVEQPLAE